MFIKQEFRQSSSSPSSGSFGMLNHLFIAVSAISVSHPRTMALADFCGFHRFAIWRIFSPRRSSANLLSITH
jgi:hypothetical protein